jgi:hypothetical protein
VPWRACVRACVRARARSGRQLPRRAAARVGGVGVQAGRDAGHEPCHGQVICAKVKVHAVCKVETAVAGDGDVAQGILRLVAQNGIRRLVVGAAADKRYSSKMTAPSVQQHAHPLCAIWFLCKGNLICTRPAAAESQAQHAPAAAATYTTRRGSLRRNDGEEPPPPPPPSVVHRIWVDNQQQEQDIQSIFAEAEKLKREQQVVAALEAQVVSSKRVIQDLQEKLSEAHCLLFSLEHEQEELRRQRDAALREAAALRDRLRHLEDKSRPAFIDLSYDDLLEATRNLDEALRLGQPGGYGAVYRAVVLRRGDKDKLEVAVKVLTTRRRGRAAPASGSRWRSSASSATPTWCRSSGPAQLRRLRRSSTSTSPAAASRSASPAAARRRCCGRSARVSLPRYAPRSSSSTGTTWSTATSSPLTSCWDWGSLPASSPTLGCAGCWRPTPPPC